MVKTLSSDGQNQMLRGDRYAEVVAQDGVHPNEIGYSVFAEHLARKEI